MLPTLSSDMNSTVYLRFATKLLFLLVGVSLAARAQPSSRVLRAYDPGGKELPARVYLLLDNELRFVGETGEPLRLPSGPANKLVFSCTGFVNLYLVVGEDRDRVTLVPEFHRVKLKVVPSGAMLRVGESRYPMNDDQTVVVETLNYLRYAGNSEQIGEYYTLAESLKGEISKDGFVPLQVDLGDDFWTADTFPQGEPWILAPADGLGALTVRLRLWAEQHPFWTAVIAALGRVMIQANQTIEAAR